MKDIFILFGTGSSIHLGAASIQNIPFAVEDDILKAIVR
jgi:hypothetical protein